MTTKTSKTTSDSGFSEDELAAMRQRAAELRAEKGGRKKADEAEACVEAITALPQPDRGLAEAIHRIVLDVAPQLDPKTWYGFPSYARDGKVVVFFKPASKFKVRYAEVGLNEWAHLDDGDMWPTAYAVVAMNPDVEARLRALVARAVS